MRDGSARLRESDDDLPSLVQFRDPSGARWSVWERDTRLDPGHRAASCLIFAHEETVRRVWSYPDNWRELSPAELFELSWAT